MFRYRLAISTSRGHMYGLPKDIDLSFFQTRELQGVVFGLYQLQMQFDRSLLLSIEGRIEHTLQKSVTSWDQGKPPISASSLLTLLGLSVVSATGTEEGTLILEFSNSDIVKVFESNEGYESYQINYEGKLIIV